MVDASSYFDLLLLDHIRDEAVVARPSAVAEVLVQVAAHVGPSDNMDLRDTGTHEGGACMADREGNEVVEVA
jgi:hypothetical protein